jgi:hypothetical protein
MPPQLFRRRGRTASTNINENQDGDINNLKASMEEIRQENPDWSTCSEGLPEEIKEALGEFYPNDFGQRRDSSIRSARASRLKESNCSSNSSIDSATFEGDFSAWARMSSTS